MAEFAQGQSRIGETAVEEGVALALDHSHRLPAGEKAAEPAGLGGQVSIEVLGVGRVWTQWRDYASPA